jgi:hypothetical protein
MPCLGHLGPSPITRSINSQQLWVGTDASDELVECSKTINLDDLSKNFVGWGKGHRCLGCLAGSMSWFGFGFLYRSVGRHQFSLQKKKKHSFQIIHTILIFFVVRCSYSFRSTFFSCCFAAFIIPDFCYILCSGFLFAFCLALSA